MWHLVLYDQLKQMSKALFAGCLTGISKFNIPVI